jgi:hypothetical protein
MVAFPKRIAIKPALSFPLVAEVATPRMGIGEGKIVQDSCATRVRLVNDLGCATTI